MPTKNKQSGHLTPRSRNKIVTYGVIIVLIYFVCFAFLSTHVFQEWAFGPFFEGMIGVFMGAGAIAIITGVIMVVQSIIASDRDKKQKVFDQKLTLYRGIIEQMEGFYKLKEGEDVAQIDEQERTELFFTQLKVALLSRPKTFRSYSQLINDISDEQGVIKEEASALLLDFVVNARDDLDVQEEMTSEDRTQFESALAIASHEAEKLNVWQQRTEDVQDLQKSIVSAVPEFNGSEASDRKWLCSTRRSNGFEFVVYPKWGKKIFFEYIGRGNAATQKEHVQKLQEVLEPVAGYSYYGSTKIDIEWPELNISDHKSVISALSEFISSIDRAEATISN